jgi:hypothetical protein
MENLMISLSMNQIMDMPLASIQGVLAIIANLEGITIKQILQLGTIGD